MKDVSDYRRIRCVGCGKWLPWKYLNHPWCDKCNWEGWQ